MVAVDDPAIRIDGDEPVGVAVEREPGVRAGCHDGLCQRGGRRRAGLDVDVHPVGRGVDDLDRRPGRLEDRGCDGGT